MPHGQWKIHLEKDSFKFSSTHMTLFPDGSKEGLHGHNYQISLSVELTQATFPGMINFSVFKVLLKELCNAWDEKILLPGQTQLLKLSTDTQKNEIEVRHQSKRYVFPLDEVVILPIENISSELLAEHLAERMAKALAQSSLLNSSNRSVLQAVEIRVDETKGQGASYRREIHLR